MTNQIAVNTYTIEGKIYVNMEQIKSLFEWDLEYLPESNNTLEYRKGIQHCIYRIQGML
jgi:hypothetical protein